MTAADAPTRCGTFVLAGEPNVGKSTLLNALVGHALAITSPKPQSTRHAVIGARTDGNTQLIFIDPPGLFQPRSLLQQRMLDQTLEHLRRADVILHLHPITQGPATSLNALIPAAIVAQKPVALVRTKSDAANLPPTDPHSHMVSAMTGDGIDRLLAWCRAQAPPGPFRCDPEEVSTQPLRFFTAEFVREAAFTLLGEELPYAIAAQVEEFREDTEPVYIRVNVYVERESQKGMVIGQRGRTIKALGALARTKIEALLDTRVYLDLWVKVLPKWRTTPHALGQLGFPTRPRGNHEPVA